MQDYQKQQIEEKWLSEDLQYRQGRVTPREHGANVVNILQEVISSYDGLQPHYSDLKELAEKRWKQITTGKAFVLPVEHRKDKLINFPETLKASFLLEDLQFRKGSITLINHNKFLSDFIVHLAANAGTLEPYFSDLEKECEIQWKQHRNNS